MSGVEMSIEIDWIKRVEKKLLGRKIVKLEYMTQDEADEWGFSNRPIKILLDNEIFLFPASDEEGNDSGVIFVNSNNLSIIPRM